MTTCASEGVVYTIQHLCPLAHIIKSKLTLNIHIAEHKGAIQQKQTSRLLHSVSVLDCIFVSRSLDDCGKCFCSAINWISLFLFCLNLYKRLFIMWKCFTVDILQCIERRSLSILRGQVLLDLWLIRHLNLKSPVKQYFKTINSQLFQKDFLLEATCLCIKSIERQEWTPTDFTLLTWRDEKKTKRSLEEDYSKTWSYS